LNVESHLQDFNRHLCLSSKSDAADEAAGVTASERDILDGMHTKYHPWQRSFASLNPPSKYQEYPEVSDSDMRNLKQLPFFKMPLERLKQGEAGLKKGDKNSAYVMDGASVDGLLNPLPLDLKSEDYAKALQDLDAELKKRSDYPATSRGMLDPRVHLNPIETETMLPMGTRWVPQMSPSAKKAALARAGSVPVDSVPAVVRSASVTPDVKVTTTTTETEVDAKTGTETTVTTTSDGSSKAAEVTVQEPAKPGRKWYYLWLA
jgi:hypothetical protein